MSRRTPLILLVLILAVFAVPARAARPDPRKVIAFARIKQEQNIFSPVPTTLRDFESAGLYYGREILERGPEGELAGFLKAIKDYGRGKIETVPIIKAEATSGGPVDPAVYARFKGELLEGLRKLPRLDGIYLALHGAMGSLIWTTNASPGRSTRWTKSMAGADAFSEQRLATKSGKCYHQKRPGQSGQYRGIKPPVPRSGREVLFSS